MEVGNMMRGCVVCMKDGRGGCEVGENHRLRMLRNYSLRMMSRFRNIVFCVGLMGHFLLQWMNLMMDKTNWT